MVTQRAARVETFAFKHALVRDAAYDGMLRAARLNLHCRVAAALRRRFPEVAAQQPEVVAQHHEAGGELDDAVDHWTLAGDRAAGRGAYREAIQAFEHALRLVEALPPSREGAVRELAALTSLGTALLSTEGYAAPRWRRRSSVPSGCARPLAPTCPPASCTASGACRSCAATASAPSACCRRSTG